MDVTIPDLPPGTAPISASPFESVESGTSVRYTLAQIAATITGGGAGPWLPITGGTLTGALAITNFTDQKKAIAVIGPSYALRLGSNPSAANIDGTDVSGNQWGPLIVGGSSLSFQIFGADKMLITSTGYLKVSNTGIYQFVANSVHEFSSDAGLSYISSFYSTPTGNNYGLSIQYPTAAPNTAGNSFIDCVDSGGYKVRLYSDGGIANFSANNTNISDANVKDQITPYSKTELAALEQSFTNVIWGKFKYRDQTHDDWNHGPTAQGVERAFEKTAPELVDESELGTKPESGVKHKVIYETDLMHIAHALLASALKRIEALEARAGA